MGILRDIWLDNTIHRECRLAVLNFITALLNALLFPYLAFVSLFVCGMTTPPSPSSSFIDSERFAWEIPLLGLPVLNALLCLGFFAAVGLWKGEPWGRRLTLFLIGFIGCFFVFVVCFLGVGLFLFLVKGTAFPRPILWSLGLFLIPAFVYAILGALLLRPRRESPLTLEQVLAWADRHHALTGRWPRADQGAITDVPGENWGDLDRALKQGTRRLPGGDSLAEILRKYRDGS